MDDGAFNQWACCQLQPGTFMTDIPKDLSWPLRPNNRFELTRRRPMPWWRRPSAPGWLPVMMEVLAALIALLVLLSFYQVVNASVERGALHREAVAARALATHHCNTLSALGAGEICLARLNTPAASTPLRLKQL